MRQRHPDGYDHVLLSPSLAWCGPCRAFAPVFDRSSRAHPDVVHAKVDTEVQHERAGALRIQSNPTVMAFRDGVLVYRQAGAMPAPALEDLITRVEALDMAEVRAKIAANS